ncbi:MAG: hypothetical protein IPN19_02215 [Elusimicrobia bacterium]|nr:hypothetical protein [Elusimicrobiota bacterium]
MIWQDTTITGTNTYRVIQGQAQVILSVTRNVSSTAGGTQRSDTTTTVNYTYDGNGVLSGATGDVRGTSGSQVFNDANRNNVVDAGEMIWQDTTITGTNTYRVIQGQAQVILSVTRNVSSTAGGTQRSDTTTTVNYTYDGNGVLSGATGDVRGTSGSQVFNDANRNNVVDAGEMIWQDTTITGTNTYRVIQGQAQVILSVTRNVSSTAGGTQRSDTTTTVNYTYDGNGVLSGATGDVRGTSGSQVFNDANRNNVVDAGEMIWQDTTITGTNTYRVIQGQAQVILSVTRNVSSTAGGTQRSDTTTTVNYTYDGNGVLSGATGDVRGTSGSQVFNDANRNNVVDAGEMIWQDTTITGTNTYRVIQGQAQVILSVTRNVSSTAGGTQRSDTTTTVNYTYDGNGVLSGATGDVRGTSGSQVFNDANRNNVVDAGR